MNSDVLLSDLRDDILHGEMRVSDELKTAWDRYCGSEPWKPFTVDLAVIEEARRRLSVLRSALVPVYAGSHQQTG